jgi:hypothetical protein
MPENDSGKALVHSPLISPQTGQAMVKISERGTVAVQSLEGLKRLAWMFSESDIIRDCYRASKNEVLNRQHAANCAVACRAALTLGVDPLMFLQHTYVVPKGGAIAIDGQIAIAVMNNSPTIKGRIRFTFSGEGDSRNCQAAATDADTGEIYTYTVTWKDVVLNGWNREKKLRDGSGSLPSQWTTQPNLMFRYRSALYLARTSFPDLLMGMRTIDEDEDMQPTGLQSGDTLPSDGLDDLVIDMAKGPTTQEELEDEATAVLNAKAEKRVDDLFPPEADNDEAADVQGDDIPPSMRESDFIEAIKYADTIPKLQSLHDQLEADPVLKNCKDARGRVKSAYQGRLAELNEKG